jgi:hypothetical protein
MRREIELAQSADRQAKEAVAIITEEQRAQAANEVFITGQKIVAVAKAMVERSRDLSLPYRERKLAHDIVKGFYGVTKDVVGASQSIGGAADGYGVSLQVVNQVAALQPQIQSVEQALAPRGKTRENVGLTGLEPVTLRLSSACSNQLSYRPASRK